MMNRRQWLKCMAVSTPLAAQVQTLERRGPPQRVIVLGAGLAGLCSGYELQTQGHQVTVLEAQLRPGGRVRTLRECFAPGLYGEAGAEAIPSAHELTQHYAHTFGLRLRPNTIPGMRSFYHVRGRRIIPDANTVWPFDLTDDERKLGIAGLRKKYLGGANEQALAAGYEKHAVQAMRAWDGQTPGEWLRSRGASAGAAELLSLGFGTDFGSAASFLLHGLNTRGSTGSFRIEGGNDHLPEEFAKPVEIRYGAAVIGVSQDERGVKVAFRRHGGVEAMGADHVVCALPCPVIGRMFREARLSDAKQRAIREQNYSRTAKVFLQARTRFWLKEGFSGNATTDLPIERLTPDPGTNAAERGALTAYPIGSYTALLEAMSEEDRVQAALGQARQIFPEMAEAFEGGVSKCWGLDPWQRGSFALHTPGQIGFIETLGQPEGRIHFAGEHTSEWTGWMQGALESARRVVREINGR
jgi:monoamine oxidase